MVAESSQPDSWGAYSIEISVSERSNAMSRSAAKTLLG
jgi:hypothetical protein